MTLREEMEQRLTDRGLSKAEAHECMQYVMQVALEQDYFQKDLYGDENCWKWDVSEFTLEDRLFVTFQKFVLDEAFKWLASRYNTQTEVLQKIRRLSSSFLNEQGKAE